ncbi:MAG: hypothetical protein ACO1NZ_09815 [Adhaeribacter sp.]
MKVISTLCLSLVLLLSSCDIDNFEDPQLTLSGRIVDSQTNKLVESGGINAGTVVRLYEGNSTQPLVYNTLPDGTFLNSRVFPGAYTYTAQGPFTPVNTDPQSLRIDQDAELVIKVVPHVRLPQPEVQVNGTTLTVKLKYEKVTQQKLVQLALMWSKFPHPNISTSASGTIKLENVETENLTTGERVYTITGLAPKTKYYLRTGARTTNPGNYYNYSSQLELQTP